MIEELVPATVTTVATRADVGIALFAEEIDAEVATAVVVAR